MSIRSATQAVAIYGSIVAAKYENVIKKKRRDSEYGNPQVVDRADNIHRPPTWQIQYFFSPAQIQVIKSAKNIAVGTKHLETQSTLVPLRPQKNNYICLFLSLQFSLL